MESPNPELALYGSKTECARTNTLILPISEISTGAVSLTASQVWTLVKKLFHFMFTLHSQILVLCSLYMFQDSLLRFLRQICAEMQFRQFSIQRTYVTMHGKLSELHCDALLLQSWGEGHEKQKIMKIMKIMNSRKSVFINFQTFSPQLENNNTLQCSSDNLHAW